MKTFLQELFEYNHISNQKLADKFSSHPDEISERAIKLFSHILNAHQIWNSRIERKQPESGVWDIQPINRFHHTGKMNHQLSLHIIHSADLYETIQYTNTKGQPFSNSIRDILFHVINHSTYHRGQIATEYRNCGIEPLITDYILYKREFN